MRGSAPDKNAALPQLYPPAALKCNYFISRYIATYEPESCDMLNAQQTATEVGHDFKVQQMAATD